MNKLRLLIIPILFASLLVQAQRPDSTRPFPNRNANGPRAFKEVITDKAKTDEGLFCVHRVEDKWYFEIPDSLLGRDIMVVNRMSRSSVNAPKAFGGYAGDELNESMIRFEKGPNNRIFLKGVSYLNFSKDSTQEMFRSVSNSNIQPISAAFDIKAFSKDSAGSVIDMTDYLLSDNDVVAFSSASNSMTSVLVSKASLQAGSLQTDKSYISGIRSYPSNIEVKTVKTYFKSPAAGGGAGFIVTQPGSLGNITIEINNSFILLPSQPMKPRLADSRVGFFFRNYTDYDANPQRVETTTMIARWKLEPKEEDMEKYLRGELVEPKKPIVLYIDPATPKKWIPYLIQGVNDWQVAFEKAGFKNAIIGKEAPENDPDWSIEDSRYSAIVYKPSSVENAYGPSVTDPRSGEILETHIGWFHNVMKLLQNWYFIQAAAIDPRARTMNFKDSLMGQLIRFVSSHEVGHTLGLMHNFGSSSTVPVENLRNKAWVEEHGHTPSIMDYARFNYVAQPEDKITQKGIFPRIGDYDYWAIEWGYRYFPQYRTAMEEKTALAKWTSEKLVNHRLWYGSGNDDPRTQTEDLGDDAVKASNYGIKNLQRILPNLLEWTHEPGEDYSNLREISNNLFGQFSLYMGHVGKYVGGIMETGKTVDDKGVVYEAVPKARQKDAVDFFNKQLFSTPTWMIDQNIFSRLGVSPVMVIGIQQDNVLGRLLSTRTLTKLLDGEAANGSNAYSVVELMEDLKKGIWSELASHKAIDIYRRNLQKSYVNTLNSIANPPPPQSANIGGVVFTVSNGSEKSDIKSVVRAHLAGLRAEISRAIQSTTDAMTRYHLLDVQNRIDKALNPKD